jgi:hypothetical protein
MRKQWGSEDYHFQFNLNETSLQNVICNNSKLGFIMFD